MIAGGDDKFIEDTFLVGFVGCVVSLGDGLGELTSVV